MVYRWSTITIAVVLFIFVAFVLFYDPSVAMVEESKSAALMNSTKANPVSVEKVIEPQLITNLVKQTPTQNDIDKSFFSVLPASLRDTPPPTALGIDEDEELIADHRVRNLFEYYLTAIGEEPLERIVARIKYDLSQQLDGVALDQGYEILEGYLQYRNNMAVIKNQFVNQYGNQAYDLTIVREMKGALRESRYGFMSAPVVDAFFSQEDQYDDYMMAKVALMSDSRLTGAEKDNLLNQLDHDSPQWIVEANHRANLVSDVRSQESALRASGGTEEDVYALRVKSYGEEQADNLKKLDERRAQWQRLVELYRIDLNSLLASAGDTSNIDQSLLQSLREQYFEGPELARIKAIDKIELGL